MWLLELNAPAGDVPQILEFLWEADTAGISEHDSANSVSLSAGFEAQILLPSDWARFQPRWRLDSTDWVAEAQRSWPMRHVGRKITLAAPWHQVLPEPERLLIRHNPSVASGTGEHPCTVLALEALEREITPGVSVFDVGTGSGILALTAAALGAVRVLGVDPDEASIQVARENAALNPTHCRGTDLQWVVGSADCGASGAFDIVVANINASVLLALWDDLERCATRRFILTGFERAEMPRIAALSSASEQFFSGDWACLTMPAPNLLP